MATHSSVLAWRIPGMGEPGGLPSMGTHSPTRLKRLSSSSSSSILIQIQNAKLFSDMISQQFKCQTSKILATYSVVKEPVLLYTGNAKQDNPREFDV